MNVFSCSNNSLFLFHRKQLHILLQNVRYFRPFDLPNGDFIEKIEGPMLNCYASHVQHIDCFKNLAANSLQYSWVQGQNLVEAYQ